MNIILTSTDSASGYRIIEILDIARGSTVRSRNIGRDIQSALKKFYWRRATPLY